MPYLHVNAVQGNGDFMNFLFTEDSLLNNLRKKTLLEFGPKQFLQKNKDDRKKD